MQDESRASVLCREALYDRVRRPVEDVMTVNPSDVKAWYTEQMMSRTREALERNGFQSFITRTKEEALQKALSIIPVKATVGVGGSVTIREIGLIQALTERGDTVVQHWNEALSKSQLRAILKQELNSDVFLCSANAVTEDGRLVNMDGTGNRVASMIFGPQKVVVVAGKNKIVKNLDEALERVKNIAAPMNSKRLNNGNNPCTKTGVCTDCNSEFRICKVTTIIERRPTLTDFSVILVGEELGF